MLVWRIMLTSVNWPRCLQKTPWSIGHLTRVKLTSTSMKNKCMNWFLQVNSLKQRHLESTVVTLCSCIFGTSWPTKWRRIINKPSLRFKEDISLPSDCDNQIRAIQYDNLALQAQPDVHQTQLQYCEDTITHLRACYVYHAKDPSKDNIINVRKHISIMTCHTTYLECNTGKGM